MNDRAADLRLQRTYGITLAEYDAMLASRGGGCWICGAPPGRRRLHVDHDHRSHRVSITVEKSFFEVYYFTAYAFYKDTQFIVKGETRVLARQTMKLRLRRESIRGIICWNCNRGLRIYFDDPVRMRNAAKYLEEFNGKK